MSYKLKTLIVFDTNSLRSTDAGEVAYSFFAFGKPFQIIEEFINEKGLISEVHLAVPSWAIEELKDQKRRQYDEDVAEYQKLAKRLSGLPHTGEIIFPEEEFNCTEYINQKAIEFITSKQIKLLELKEDTANNVLKSMMVRVLKDEGRKAPFASFGKGYKDAGFKDNLVWESLLSFEEIPNYDKIIFLTKDGDFNKHCIEEFIEKWARHFTISKDEINVKTELQKDYENLILNRKVYEYCEKEFFINYFDNLIKAATAIQIDGNDFKIEEYKVQNYCSFVNSIKDEDGDYETPVIESDVLITIIHTEEEEIIEIPVKAKTLLSDYETMGIEETTFEPLIY
jgi:hypothetical protein